MNSEPRRKGHTPLLTDLLRDEKDARAYLEGKRWPNGVVCAFPDCGGSEITPFEVKSGTRKNGKHVPARSLYKCKACQRQFSVTKGTIFEDSKIPLRTWLIVAQRMCVSKKAVSALQIQREFGVTYESAWFMCHRIRWAMTDKNPTLLRGTIEADETYIGGKPRGHREHRKGESTMSTAIKASWDKKTPVFGIKERGGRVRAQVIPKVSADAVGRMMFHNIDREASRLMTDEHAAYKKISAMLPHDVIRHKSEYVRGEVHTQGIESFWAVLKRGLVGTYHSVDAGYLNQYVQEFAFRANTRHISDEQRFNYLLSNVEGRVDWYVGKQAASSEPE
jgi:transposase-like protein